MNFICIYLDPLILPIIKQKFLPLDSNGFYPNLNGIALYITLISLSQFLQKRSEIEEEKDARSINACLVTIALRK
jgi:hypothetical protein